MVIGALIASSVHANVPLVISQGGVEVAIQDTLNMIMPNLLPILLVFLVYWLLGKKGFTSTKAVFLILIISFIGYFLGLLGA